MTTPDQNQDNKAVENKQNDKEYNFRKLENQLNQERAARLELEKKLEERNRQPVQQEIEEDDDEPYVNKKRMENKFNSFEKKMEQRIDQRAEEKARGMMERDKQESWLRNNPDFYEVMQHAEKFAEADPELAETILRMPEGFDRQKLVYKNIKALGINKPIAKQSTIQEKIDSNKRSPFYQPSGVGTSPYSSQADFSQGGQKQAYDKMKELQARLRI